MLRNPPFGIEKYLAVSKMIFDDRPLYDICQYENARRKAIDGKNIRLDPTSEEDLKKYHSRP